MVPSITSLNYVCTSKTTCIGCCAPACVALGIILAWFLVSLVIYDCKKLFGVCPRNSVKLVCLRTPLSFRYFEYVQGTGNHFIELCLDEKDRVWLLLHSGSRGIGNRIGMYFIELARRDMLRLNRDLPDKDLAYLTEGTQCAFSYLSVLMFLNFIMCAVACSLKSFQSCGWLSDIVPVK